MNNPFVQDQRVPYSLIQALHDDPLARALIEMTVEEDASRIYANDSTPDKGRKPLTVSSRVSLVSRAVQQYIERQTRKNYRKHMHEFIARGGEVQILSPGGRLMGTCKNISLPWEGKGSTK